MLTPPGLSTKSNTTAKSLHLFLEAHPFGNLLLIIAQKYPELSPRYLHAGRKALPVCNASAFALIPEKLISHYALCLPFNCLQTETVGMMQMNNRANLLSLGNSFHLQQVAVWKSFISSNFLPAHNCSLNCIFLSSSFSVFKQLLYLQFICSFAQLATFSGPVL